MDVTDVLRDRMQPPAGLQRMVTVSIAVHGALVAGLFLAPRGWLQREAEAPRSVMTISLGGSGASGPQNTGLTAVGGKAVQVQEPPPDTPKREEARPPAAKAPEMTTPVDSVKAPQTKAGAPVSQAPDAARGRTPTRGAEVRQGSAVTETRARGLGFGLASGGVPGSGATLDVADFCCPDYILQMINRIRSNWDDHADSRALVIVRFTIERDGTITKPTVERSSGNPVLDLAAQRAVVLARQLPPLPPQFPNQSLGVHLNFDYQR